MPAAKDAHAEPADDIRARRMRAAGSTTGGVAVLALLAWSHVAVQDAGWSGEPGLLAVPGHLFEVAAAVLLLWLCAAVGRGLLYRLEDRWPDPLEELLFSTALGTGAVSTVLLAQGFFLVHPLAVFGTLVLLAALARRGLTAVPILVGRCLRTARAAVHANGAPPAVAGAAVLFLLVAFFLLVLALAPPTDWDSLMYHLEIPARFLDEGRIFLPEDNLHVSRVGLVHLLYLPLLALGSASGPGVLSTLFALLMGLAVLACGRRFLAPGAGLLGLALLWGSSTILLVAVTPRVDVTLALYAILAQHALLRALTDDRPGGSYLLAAFLLGLGAGIKYHGLVMAAAAVPAAAWVAWSRWSGRYRLRALAAFAGVGLAVGLPWLVKNWILLDAPLYPFLAAPVVQPWLADILGGASFAAVADPGLLSFVWQLRAPFNLWDAFLDPGALTIEFEGGWYFAGPALAVAPLALLYLRRPAVLWLAVPSVVYVVILLAAFPTSNLRYFVPAVPGLTLVAADAVLRTLDRLRRPGVTRGVVGLLVAASLIAPALMAGRWLSGTRAVEHFAGQTSARGYMERHHDPSVSTLAPVLTVAQDSLPEESLMLMLLDARGFHFRSAVLQDNKATNWALLRESETAESCLAGTSISHVLLGKGVLSYYARGGLDPSRLGFDGSFRAFAARCLDPVYEDRVFVIFAVTEEPAGPSR